MYKEKHIKSNRGLTLIELVVAMFIAGIVSIAIFTAFKSQQKSYLIQDQVAEMQQNIRASMDIMVRDIRMAGYDLYYGTSSAGIVSSNASALCFTMVSDNDTIDNDNDTIKDEEGELKTITYSLYDVYDDGNSGIGRKEGTGNNQPLAENIQAIGFAYAYSTNATTGVLDTSNGNIIWAVDTDGDGNWNNLDANDDGVIAAADGPGVGANGIIDGFDTGTSVNTDQIRAVRIWILSRADREDPDFRNTKTYVVGSQVITPNDGFRRRLLTTTVQCRNMGL